MDQRMVGGTMEADFQFPWVINVSGTLTGKGVLIARAGSDPRTCGRDQLQWRSHLLQTGPAAVAQTGTIASISRTQTLPPGKVAVWRGPVILNGPKTFIAKSPTASLCQGDRGSGFISSIGSANVVAGIASQAHTGDCTQPNLEFTAVDVYRYLDWIRTVTGLFTWQFYTTDGSGSIINQSPRVRQLARQRVHDPSGRFR